MIYLIDEKKEESDGQEQLEGGGLIPVQGTDIEGGEQVLILKYMKNAGSRSSSPSSNFNIKDINSHFNIKKNKH